MLSLFFRTRVTCERGDNGTERGRATEHERVTRHKTTSADGSRARPGKSRFGSISRGLMFGGKGIRGSPSWWWNGELLQRQPQFLRPLTHPVYLFGKDLDRTHPLCLFMVA